MNSPTVSPGGQGEMAGLICTFDWSQTPLGPRAQWPISLRTVVDVVVASQFPMALLWGRELILLYNDGYRLICGAKHPAALGQPTREIWAEVWHLLEPIFAAVLERGETLNFEDKVFPLQRHGYREEAHFKVCYSPVRVEDGSVGGVLAVLEETTARIQAEASLRESQQRLEQQVQQRTQELEARISAYQRAEAERQIFVSLADRSLEFIGMCDLKFRPFYVNEAGQRLIGLDSLEHAKTIRVQDCFFPEDQAYITNEFFPRVLREGHGEVEIRFRHFKTGAAIWMIYNVFQVSNEAGEPAGYATVSRDITQRKQAEEAQRESERLLRTVMDLVPHFIFVKDRQSRHLLVNRACAAASGMTPEQMTGLSDLDFVPNRAEAEFFMRADREVIDGGQPKLIPEERLTNAAGETRILQTTKIPFLAPGGVPSLMGVSVDITEHKKAEEERVRLETQFLQVQRLQSVGALAGGIAHDLNNILAPMLLVLPLLRQSMAEPESQKLLETLETSALRGTDIIKQLLTFARGRPNQRVPVPLRHLLRDMEKIAAETFPRDIVPKARVPNDLWPVVGDPTQFHQVLLNLCVNARDAMPNGGQLLLEAKNVLLDETAAARTPEAQPGPYVCVSVSDTGTGIAAADLERIFDPFFTTKEFGKGTGLGLSTVLGIVRGHKGFVRVKSELGRGTTFELYFPASPAAEAPAIALPPRPVARGRGQLLLVVDDERGVRESLQRIFEKHGYRVLAASQGAEALKLYAEHLGEVAAVVTDVMMPVMGGVALVHALRAVTPKLPAITMTGLMEQESLKELQQLDAVLHLTKPFASDVVLEALASLLNGGQPAN